MGFGLDSYWLCGVIWALKSDKKISGQSLTYTPELTNCNLVSNLDY